MVNKLVPPYLSSLIPDRVSDTSSYNLRNSSNLQNLNCRTSIYSKSFIPHTVNIWNTLPSDITNSNSFGEFKRKLKNNINSHIYFNLNYGSRFCQIVHSRLRLGCSDLNDDKFSRHISDSSQCRCGYPTEDALHFFFICPIYSNLRLDKYFFINGFDLSSVLNGHPRASKLANNELLKSIHCFIVSSRQFTDFSIT